MLTERKQIHLYNPRCRNVSLSWIFPNKQCVFSPVHMCRECFFVIVASVQAGGRARLYDGTIVLSVWLWSNEREAGGTRENDRGRDVVQGGREKRCIYTGITLTVKQLLRELITLWPKSLGFLLRKIKGVCFSFTRGYSTSWLSWF